MEQLNRSLVHFQNLVYDFYELSLTSFVLELSVSHSPTPLTSIYSHIINDRCLFVLQDPDNYGNALSSHIVE